MEQVQLNWIANFIRSIADDVLRDLHRAQIVHQDQALRKAAGQALYNTSPFKSSYPARVAADAACKNAKGNADGRNACIEHDRAGVA
jgi:hypothetical protein